MPYFLTDQYRGILEASQAQHQPTIDSEEEKKNKSKSGAAADKDQGPVGIYKSIFLRTKVEQ